MPQKTLCNLAEEIFSSYRSLVNEREFTKLLSSQSIVGTRLRLLSAVLNGSPTLDTFSYGEAIVFHETLLDAIALQCATGMQRSVFAEIEVGEPSLLGRSRDRSAFLRAENERQLDWHFSLLVQGWASSKGFGPLRDLRGDQQFKGSEVCDFALPLASGAVELLECKRVHPRIGNSIDAKSALIAKISRVISKAASQFEQTAQRSKFVVACRHVLIDVSSYSEQRHEVPSRYADVQINGFSSEEISTLADTVRSSLPDDKVDKVTLCWRTLVAINCKIRAIVQNPIVAFSCPSGQSAFPYGGWTVEGYPSSAADYRELRVSSVVRSLDWILTCYNNYSSPGTFYGVGPLQNSST